MITQTHHDISTTPFTAKLLIRSFKKKRNKQTTKPNNEKATRQNKTQKNFLEYV